MAARCAASPSHGSALCDEPRAGRLAARKLRRHVMTWGAFGLLTRRAWLASTDQAELRQALDMQRVDVWLTESTRTK
jgi:hypothetical protein